MSLRILNTFRASIQMNQLKKTSDFKRKTFMTIHCIYEQFPSVIQSHMVNAVQDKFVSVITNFKISYYNIYILIYYHKNMKRGVEDPIYIYIYI